MSTADERRRQKAAEKAKKRRDEASKTRSARVARQSGVVALGPLATTWATSNWSERGATVRAAFARGDVRGTLTGVLMVCHLDTGALELTVRPALDPKGWDALAAQHGGDQAMLELDPLIVSRLAHDTVAWGHENGVEPPEEWPDLRRMFEGLPPETCPFEIQVGAPEAPPPRSSATGGLLDRIKGWFR